jgi:vacuolar-type H+-ATPase subunit E/Vma4
MAAREGLDALAEEILDEARQRAEGLTKGAEERAAATMRQAREAATAQRRAAAAEAEREAARYRARVRSAAHLEARRRLLAKREEVIVRALAMAHQRLLTALTAEERRTALEKAIVEAATALGGGRLTVRANPQDTEALTPALLQELQSRLESAGVSAELVVGTPAEIGGGAIVSTEEGRAVYDNSFEGRLERQQWELRNAVWEALSRVPVAAEAATT